MSLLFYKWLHVTGVVFLFTAFGGLFIATASTARSWRKGLAILHGIGLLLLLVAGFGMLARLGISWPWPGWVWAKLIIWLLMGGLMAPIRRVPKFTLYYGIAVVVFGSFATYLALFKPF